MRHKILSSYQQSLLQKEETWRGQVEERKLKGVEIEEKEYLTPFYWVKKINEGYFKN